MNDKIVIKGDSESMKRFWNSLKNNNPSIKRKMFILVNNKTKAL